MTGFAVYALIIVQYPKKGLTMLLNRAPDTVPHRVRKAVATAFLTAKALKDKSRVPFAIERLTNNPDSDIQEAGKILQACSSLFK